MSRSASCGASRSGPGPSGVRPAACTQRAAQHRASDTGAVTTRFGAAAPEKTSGTLSVESYAEHAVRVLAVIAEPLAVIAGNGDDRRVERSRAPERVDEARDLRVGVGDFAVVGVAAGFPRTRPAARTARAGRRGGPRGRTATTADSASHRRVGNLAAAAARPRGARLRPDCAGCDRHRHRIHRRARTGDRARRRRQTRPSSVARVVETARQRRRRGCGAKTTPLSRTPCAAAAGPS